MRAFQVSVGMLVCVCVLFSIRHIIRIIKERTRLKRFVSQCDVRPNERARSPINSYFFFHPSCVSCLLARARLSTLIVGEYEWRDTK